MKDKMKKRVFLREYVVVKKSMMGKKIGYDWNFFERQERIKNG